MSPAAIHEWKLSLMLNRDVLSEIKLKFLPTFFLNLITYVKCYETNCLSKVFDWQHCALFSHNKNVSRVKESQKNVRFDMKVWNPASFNLSIIWSKLPILKMIFDVHISSTAKKWGWELKKVKSRTSLIASKLNGTIFIVIS